MNSELNNPLVTIIVITYNSSKYVIETLQSAKAQTYGNLELIISDDCSTDGTQDICRDWINTNKERFVKVELLESGINTGISANGNRGLHAAKGEWIKLIAGDDILHERCVERMIRFVSSVKHAKIVSSKCQGFRNIFLEENFIKIRDLSDSVFFQDKTTATQQFFMLFGYNYVDASTTLINRAFMLSTGGFEEKFPSIEDLPFWRKVTAMDYKIHLLNEITAFYRIHPKGSSRVLHSLFKRRNYLLLENALTVFDKHNKVNISKQEKTILVRKYMSLLGKPYGNPVQKICQLIKIIKYWPGIKYFINQKKIIRNYQESILKNKFLGITNY